MTFVPAHRVIAAPGASVTHTAFVLHGILGTGRNFTTIVRQLAAALPHWRYVLIDHRNHGASEDPSPPDSLVDVAADLDALETSSGLLPDAIIAHSYGAKVALRYCQAHPERALTVWILDAPLGKIDVETTGDSEIGAVLTAIERNRGPFPSRAHATQAMLNAGLPAAIANWLATNVRRRDSALHWRFDLERISAMVDDYCQTDLWPVLESPRRGLEVHVVRGATSDRWSPQDIERLQRLHAIGAVKVHELDAGHWVHVDAPEGLIDIITRSST